MITKIENQFLKSNFLKIILRLIHALHFNHTKIMSNGERNLTSSNQHIMFCHALLAILPFSMMANQNHSCVVNS